jgi:hypothetical protein
MRQSKPCDARGSACEGSHALVGAAPCEVVIDTSSSGIGDREERRRAAIVSFPGAGMDPKPTPANLVKTLADARRTVMASTERPSLVQEWLTGEMRVRGIRENAAVLAVLEVTEPGSALAREFVERYPDRRPELNELLAVLGL